MPVGERSRRHGGFTYVWLLALMAIMAVGLSVIGPVWSQAVQRDRETELIKVGVLYADAIERYHNASFNALSSAWPATLDQLLLDDRYKIKIRYLRQLYPDPMNPGQPWVAVYGPSGGIVGVASASQGKPLLQVPWSNGRQSLAPSEHYSQWAFLAKVD